MNYQPKTVAQVRCYLQGAVSVIQTGLATGVYGNAETVIQRVAQLQVYTEVIAMCELIERANSTHNAVNVWTDDDGFMHIAGQPNG